jgi:plastocyanin
MNFTHIGLPMSRAEAPRAAELKEFVVSGKNAICSTLVAVGFASIMLAAALLPGSPHAATRANANAMLIDNFTFTPQTLTLKAGATVTWTNKDDIPHGIASENNAFPRSKALDTDDGSTFTFARVGSCKYYCYMRPHMTGTIVVERSDRTGERRLAWGYPANFPSAVPSDRPV